MARLLARAVVYGLAAVALVYILDWAVWRVRAAMSPDGAMGSLQVTRMTVASLKNNKDEYYLDGTQTVACSRSLFQQAGGGACWWLRRHAQVVVRY